MALELPTTPVESTAAHIIQLFDTIESRADSAADFLAEGSRDGAALLIVAQPDAARAIDARLAGQGIRIEELAATGRLVALDADTTLRRLMQGGRPNRDRFDEIIGYGVQTLMLAGRPLRIYGEMVDLLAGEGNFDGARDLEMLWNDLVAREPLALFCGYASEHFGDPRVTDALGSICRSHTEVRSDSRDTLGTFLIHKPLCR